MVLSVFTFKIKRFFQAFFDFFKNIFEAIYNFFSFLRRHPRTEGTKIKIKKTGKKIFDNIRDNRENWKRRTFDNHGFSIGEEDI